MTLASPREAKLARSVGLTWLEIRLKTMRVGREKNQTILGFADLTFHGAIKVRECTLRRNGEGAIHLDEPMKLRRVACHECRKGHDCTNAFCPSCGVPVLPTHWPDKGIWTHRDIVKFTLPGTHETVSSLAYAAYVSALEGRAEWACVDYLCPEEEA